MFLVTSSRYTIRTVVIILCTLFSVASLAQNTQVPVQHLSTKDGLSQRSIVDIHQDAKGFMWFSSINGIDVYDGYNFSAFGGSNQQLTNNLVSRMHSRKDGTLWFAINGSALVELNPITNTSKRLVTFDANEYFVTYLQSSAHANWLISTRGIYFFEHGPEVEMAPLRPMTTLPKSITINAAVSTDNGNILLATNQGILNFNTHDKSISEVSTPNILDRNTVNLLGHNNQIWLITGQGGIAQLNKQQPDKSKLLTSIGKPVSDATIFENNLYLATDSAIHSIALTGETTKQLFSLAKQFPNLGPEISTIHFSSDGKLWMGTEGDGVFVWDSKLLPFYHHIEAQENGLVSDIVWSIYEDPQSPWLWIGTSSGLDRLNYETLSLKHFPLGQLGRRKINSFAGVQYNQNIIYRVLGRRGDNLWLSLPHGIVIINVITGITSEPDVDPPTMDILKRQFQSMWMDNDGVIWMSRAKVLWAFHTGENTLTKHAVLEQTLDEEIHTVLGHLVTNTDILFSTSRALYSYDTVSNQTKEIFRHGFEIDRDAFLFFESGVYDKTTETLWLSFLDKGIYGINATTGELKKSYTAINHDIDPNVYQLHSPTPGILWFSSHQGIYRLDTNTDKIRNFGLEQGLLAEEYNAFASTSLRNNKIVYGSMSGITVFSPNELQIKKVPPKIEILELEVSNEKRLHLPHADLPLTVKVNYNDFNIKVNVSSLMFDNENTRYQFQLLGADEYDIPLTQNNYIQLSHLSPGRTTLNMWSHSLINGMRSRPKSITFDVSAPFYKTPVAYGSYALAVCLLVFLSWYIASRHLLVSHSQISYRENRLRLALKGSNSEVWEWMSKGNKMTAKRIKQASGTVTSVNFDEYIKLIHPQDVAEYRANWNAFIASDNADDVFNCHYRLRDSDGDWSWFRDLGKVVKRDNANRPLLISGAYTNITEAEANKEKAFLYGEALQYSQDWVLILNSQMSSVTANQAFCNVFNVPDGGRPFSPLQLNFHSEKLDYYKTLLDSLDVGAHWRGEDVLFTLTGEKYYVLLNITVSRNATTKQLYYLIVMTDISSRKLAEDELRYLANYDTLTNLPNRKYFMERVEQLINKCSRDNTIQFAVLFIDLDHFKNINDSLGHSEGDALLKEAGKRLCTELRISDIVARFGGDEFIILLEDYSSEKHLNLVAQRLNDMFTQPITLSTGNVNISASIGIARFPDDGTSAEQLLKAADLAMYNAKRNSKGSYEFFIPGMVDTLNERIKVEKALAQCVADNQFINYYQPIVDCSNGDVVGIELLLRWQYEGRVVSVGPYIEMIEELNLIKKLTEQLLVKGLNDLKSLSVGRPDLYLSVNIAASHLTQMALVDFTRDTLQRCDVAAHKLRYEITENALIEDGDSVSQVMHGLSSLGIKIALDDFGTGFSSLSYLRQLPVDVIKIDRSFVSGINNSSADEAIIDATLLLAKALGMSCIAEGVERPHELDYLQGRDCVLIQGYFFSKPVPIETLPNEIHVIKSNGAVISQA